MNKKGTTIVELIISLALISVVLLFMMKLLIDINNSNINDSYAKNNQFNRVEIIKTIQNDLKNKRIVDVTHTNTSNSVTINFIFKDNTKSIITLRSDTITYYIESSNLTRRWEMKDCTVYLPIIQFDFLKDSRNFSFVLNIQIDTINDFNNELYNNHVDDITISYFGYSSDLNNDLNMCIGTGC